MGNPSQQRQRQMKRRKLLAALYDLMPVGIEQQNMSVAAIVETIGEPDLTKSVVDAAIRDFQGLDIMARRLEWGHASKGEASGRHYHWTLLVPRESAEAILTSAEQTELSAERRPDWGGVVRPNNAKGKPHKVKREEPPVRSNGQAIDVIALAPERSTEEVRAIAGPERPSPFAGLATLRKDESYALVEATRQYRARTKTVRGKLDELARTAAELGITIDMTAVEGAMTIETDDRMEQIALVLPYIDRIEDQLARQAQVIEEYRQRTKDLDALRVTERKQKQQIERLIAEKSQAVVNPPA